MPPSPVRITLSRAAGTPSPAAALRAWWVGWQRASVNRRVLAASVLLAALTVLCKLAAGAREIAAAHFFGTGDAMDAMVIALMIPMLAVTVFARTAGTALLPTLVRLRTQEGQGRANTVLQQCTAWTLLVTFALAAALMIAAPWLLPLVSPGFSGGKHQLAQGLLWILLPLLLLYGLVSLWEAVLHSSERFAATGWTPVLAPLVALLSVLALQRDWGIRALAVGIVAGVTVEALTLGWLLQRSGYRLRPRLGRLSPELKQVMQQYFPLVGAAALMGSTTLIDNAMAASLGSGSVATLSYGNKLVALAMSIPILSLSRVIFPYFSKAIAAEQWQAVKRLLVTYRRVILWGTIPLASVLIIFSRQITALVLQHGAFDADCTQAVARVQTLYALQIPVYAVGILYVRLLSALHRNGWLALGTVISIVLNIVFNFLLMRVLGVAGIALSTSLVYAASCAFLVAVGTRQLRLQSDAPGQQE